MTILNKRIGPHTLPLTVMSTGAQKVARVSDLPVRCSFSAPRLELDDVPVTVQSLDRKGAVLLLDGPWTSGDPLVRGDRIELCLELPGERAFGRRSMRILGKVTRESRDHLGRVWLVVTFHHLAFRTEENGDGEAQ